MKKTLLTLTTILCIACGGSTTHRSDRTPLPPPQEESDEVFSYYNQAMDLTLLITEIKPVRYRAQPPVGNPTAGMFVSMSAVHQTNRLTQTPENVSFNLTTAISDIPPKLLLINIPNGRWIKVEPEVVNGVYVSVIPLTAMETFLDSERNGVVGFIGGETRFVQFAINDPTLQLFKRFMTRLRQVQPQDPNHQRDSSLPHK